MRHMSGHSFFLILIFKNNEGKDMESKIRKRHKVAIAAILIGLLPLVLAPGKAGISDPNSQEDIAALQKQNKELRQQLEGYQSLDEDRLAWKVFNKAKQHLFVYLTAGGFAFAAAGVIGYTQVIKYARNRIKKKVAAISDTEIKNSLLTEGKKQIDSFANEVEKSCLYSQSNNNQGCCSRQNRSAQVKRLKNVLNSSVR